MKGRKTKSHYGMLPEILGWWHKENGISAASPRTLQKAYSANDTVKRLWEAIYTSLPPFRLWQDSFLLVEVNRVIKGRKRSRSYASKKREKKAIEDLVAEMKNPVEL